MEENNLLDHGIANPGQLVQTSNGIGFWRGLLIGLSIIGAQIVAAIFASFIALAFVSFDDDNFLPLVMGITMIISFPMAVWFLLRFYDLAKTAWVWDSKYLVLLVISVVMAFSTSYAIGVLMEFLPNYDQLVAQYAEMFEGFNPILLFIGGAIIGPICEEIIFRGIILKELLIRYDAKKAILFSALIFSVIHMVPIQMIATFAIGIVLGYIYYKTKSLWLVCAIHLINNMIAFSMGTESMVEGESTREWFGNDLLFFGSIIFAIAAAFAMYLLFERYHGPAKDVQLTEVA